MTYVATAPAAAPAPPAEHDHGLIGDRELVCVQTIEIGRLRSAPVPITPGTFIAVSGRGPKGDSNGSGKTTFLAAVSLLHGEVGWHLAGGAPEAASLLFDGTKAGVDVQRYARADHGYIIGVFRSRDKDDPVTVWVRVNAVAPVLRVRAEAGIHLVHADTSTARAAAADAIWAVMPKQDWGSRSYARELYGTTPRCMAWLQARGNQTPGQSLLKLSQEMLTPEHIGVALLELLGRDDLLDADRTARAELDATTREVEELLEDDIKQRRQEDDELKAIAGRDQARERLARADRLWLLHYAKGLVEAAARAADARADVRPAGDSRREARRQLRRTTSALDALGDGTSLRAEVATAQAVLEQAFERLQRAGNDKAVAQDRLNDQLARIEELTVAAESWDGTPVEGLRSAEHDLAETLAAANAVLAVATSERKRSESDLLAAEAGTAGLSAAAAVRLASAGVQAAPLLDQLEIDPTARAHWEPRLALYRDAVVVSAADRPAALVAAEPGDVLVAGEAFDEPLPEGVSAAPPAAVPFLRALAKVNERERSAQLTEHVTVVGGFEHPITGREARVAAARRGVERSIEAERIANGDVARHQIALEGIRQQLEAALAADSLFQAQRGLTTQRQHLAELDSAENGAAETYRLAVESHGTASEKWGGFAQHRQRLEESKDRDGQELLKATFTLRAAVESWLRQRDRLPYWTQRWGGEIDSAISSLASDAADHPSREDRSSSAAYRRAANHAIDRALFVCGIDSTSGEGAPTGSGVDLAVTERSAAGTAADNEDGGQSYERQATAFHGVADALGAWLERLRVEDGATAAHIASDRERRSKALNAAHDLCEERRRNLPVLQDQIERLLRTSLAAVGEKLNQLDAAAQGSGADLLIEPQRPATARESWVWRVTPRYRRGPNGGLVPYTERANTATEKLLAIHLVLAALFAATAARGADNGRVLILDELGDSLGDYHREAVLQALARTAAESGITVLGTCQDGVLEDAARHCGLVLYFQFRDPSDILNAPTRVFGTTHDGSIVEQCGPFIERLG